MKEFVGRLEERATLERNEQEEFLLNMKASYFDEQIEEFGILNNMNHIIKGKFNKSVAQAFKILKGE